MSFEAPPLFFEILFMMYKHMKAFLVFICIVGGFPGLPFFESFLLVNLIKEEEPGCLF